MQFASLVERARIASREPPVPVSEASLPASLRDIDWNAYRTIRFRPEHSLWRGEGLPFEAQFFHLGFIYRLPVEMYVVDGSNVNALAFQRGHFSYEGVPAPPSDAGLGYAGVRLHAALNSPDYKDEVAVFQGASYFRVVGRGNAHGLSARALAIDMGEPTPEEFPRFSALYLVRPQPAARGIWVLGSLESARVTGACAFFIEPGDETVVDVTMRVFPRGPVTALGIAPFSSMHLFGEAEPHRFGDIRPEVHDSDGLAMWTHEGEHVFRPLRNPARTTVSEFRLDSPKGFGLLQRDRSFASYEDLTERYEARPSAWVEPVGDFGAGKLRLLEFATPLESDDNIALAWIPDQIPLEGLALRYRIHFGLEVEKSASFGRVSSTRLTQLDPQRARFYVDFTVPHAAELSDVEVEVGGAGVNVLSKSVQKNPNLPGFRAVFELSRADPARELALRAYLRRGQDALTETWSYPWQPMH
jgi:glucans biosynthesis protein